MKQLSDYIYYEEPAGVIYCGDCLEILPLLPDKSIDLVVTDPPYGINLDTSWLTSLHVQIGKPANKSDDKIINDEKPFMEWF